nr:uncharacterized protein LOC104109072 isoform X4 [Nicotiana tomentosiformis]
MKNSGGRPATYDLEYRAKEDDSWYGVLVVVNGETLTVKYEGYPETFDSKIAAKDFKSKEEIDEFVGRFRNISPQLQDSECGSVMKEGMIVCAACNAFCKDDMLFYDAVVEAKDCLTASGIEGICIIKGTPQVDPRLASFVKLANQKLRKSSCKSTSTSEHGSPASRGLPLNKRGRYLSSVQKPDSSSKGISIAKNMVDARCTTEATDCNYSRHWDHDKDLGGQCSNYHLILVENLERNLLPSSLRDFIHEHTSVLSQVHVFACPSYMPYARGIIVADCEKKLQKIQQFLDNPIHLIVSSRGRPVVISVRDLRHTMIKLSLGSLVYGSQDICQAKSICQDLIVVHSGSEAYRRAHQAKDLFLEFMTHQQRLYKKLALEESVFLQTLQFQPSFDTYIC